MDSIEIYFVFFWVLLYFLRILEDYKNFWAFKRNKKTKEKCHTETGRTFGPWPDAVGSAHSQGGLLAHAS
jgi:hypothetical protein